MRNFSRFVLHNSRLLWFGFTLSFISSFGQTFLISLYVPELGETFNLNNTVLSSMYAAATLGSAFCLPWVGRYVDLVSLHKFTGGVLAGLIISLLILSVAPHPVVIVLGFWGLRLCGQGLLPHTGISTMARAFDGNRGKAISLATMGHPAGEAILPLLVAFAILAFGWRVALQLSALFILLIIFPLLIWLTQSMRQSVIHPYREAPADTADSTFSNPVRLLRTRTFWILLPAVFLPGFLNTAIIFFQVQLGESRGWTSSWVAGSLAAFAAASALSMLFSGPVVDRFSARRSFPLFLFPYLAGLLLLATFRFPVIYPVSLFLMGLSNGAGSTIKNAVLAELYGTTTIGAVRSFFQTIVVFSTALAPITFGLLLDAGTGFSFILYGCAVVVILAIGWSWQLVGSKVSPS